MDDELGGYRYAGRAVLICYPACSLECHVDIRWGVPYSVVAHSEVDVPCDQKDADISWDEGAIIEEAVENPLGRVRERVHFFEKVVQ